MSRRPSAATSLCIGFAVSTPVKDRGIPTNTMQRRRPRRTDALTATAKPKSCTTKMDNHRSVEKSSGAWKSSWVKTQNALLTEMTSVSGEMTSVTCCWRGRTDTSAPVRKTSSWSFTLWPREALHTSSTTCCPLCQRCDKRWALRSLPLPQPFTESHLFSFPHPGRPSPLSHHTPERTRLSL